MPLASVVCGDLSSPLSTCSSSLSASLSTTPIRDLPTHQSWLKLLHQYVHSTDSNFPSFRQQNQTEMEQIAGRFTARHLRAQCVAANTSHGACEPDPLALPVPGPLSQAGWPEFCTPVGNRLPPKLLSRPSPPRSLPALGQALTCQ